MTMALPRPGITPRDWLITSGLTVAAAVSPVSPIGLVLAALAGVFAFQRLRQHPAEAARP